MKMMGLMPTYPMNQITADLIMNPKPPTLYAILNSIANYDSETKTKIRNLASATHDKIFDFDYELSNKIDKDQFEIDILNHFMMRRIGFETVTAFQLYLENKLHEILPYFNLMFDSLTDFDLFNGGETITRSVATHVGSSAETRTSDLPQNKLSDITAGTYVSTQGTNTGTSDGTTNETTSRSPVDKMDIYKKYLETKQSVMSMIYKELDILFYGIAD